MVQKSLILKSLLVFLGRIVLFFVIVITSALISDPVHNFILNVLQYKTPSGFFGFTLADWDLALFITSTFFIGVIFGGLGRKIDYIFIALLIILDIWEWTGTENITLNLWVTLIVTIIVSNAIGFGLKLLRQRFLPKLKV